MAEKPIQVRKEEPKFKSMDYEFLRETGIDLVQKLSGDIWTDFNHHDPGVTILEQLCYALMDLGYRTDFNIQDLLNAYSRKNRKSVNNAFFDASEILPTNPVSIEDFRILMIDRIQYVKNAWVEPVRDNLQGIQGLYRILLQVDDVARNPKTLQDIKKEVFNLFNQHRNLCEDIESIQILDVEEVVIFADLDISSEIVAEEILATILFQLEEHLNPTIKFHTLEELQEEGYGVDEIFDGPAPVHGFIKKTDLKPLKQEVYISKLIELISSVEGVRRITYFRVEKNGIPIEGDVIQIEPNMYPVLSMDTINEEYLDSSNYPVQFYRGALNYELDLNTTNQLLYSLYARYKKGYQMKMLYDDKEYPSSLKPEDIPKYFSIQNTFPLTYGVNAFGLPDNAKPTRERLAMIKQLRGYLMFFEQIMANYLSQLANVKHLFSIENSIDRTYYHQVPENVPGLHEVINAKDMDAFNRKLEEVTKEFDPYTDRRNRFLDHLLARFGEQFTTDFLLKVSNYVGFGTDDEDTDPEVELIKAKIEFLQQYVEISRNRGKGFNYLGQSLDGWNVSGLEKRVCLLLHMTQSGNESLLTGLNGETIDEEKLDDILEIASPDVKEGYINLEDIEDKTNAKPQDPNDQLDALNDLVNDEDKKKEEEPISYVPPQEDETLNYTKSFVFRGESLDDLMLDLLGNGIMSHNYIVLPVGGRDAFAIYYKGNKDIGVVKVREVSTRLAARVEIERLIKYLHKVNHRGEGMHVVEHVLLRPQAKDRHGFILEDDQERSILVSYELGDMDDQRRFSDEVPRVGIYRDNYILEKDDKEQHTIVLKDNYGKLIAKHPEKYHDRAAAEDQIEDIIDYIRSFKKGNASIYENVKYFVEQREGLEEEDGNVYSLNLSLVLPKWPTRFQNEDFRMLLRNIVMVNAPVHVNIDFYWLDIEPMAEFEEVYYGWLEERILLEPKQPDLDNKALGVVRMLKDFQEQAKQDKETEE